MASILKSDRGSLPMGSRHLEDCCHTIYSYHNIDVTQTEKMQGVHHTHTWMEKMRRKRQTWGLWDISIS